MTSKNDSIDIVFSFDTTGSMYPCLTQVRRCVVDTVNKLFKEIPGIRIGVIAHGDYCDGPRTITRLDLTTDKNAIVQFVQTVAPTDGGDAPEAYEQAMLSANSMKWRVGVNRALVIIGDEVPHLPTYHANVGKVNWRDQLSKLHADGVNVYGVQCLRKSHARPFYDEIAQKSGGFRLELDQFNLAADTLMAICYKQAGAEKLEQMQKEVQASGRMTPALAKTYGTLMGKTITVGDHKVYFGSTKKAGLHPVEMGKFQTFKVDFDTPIATFVSSNGIPFQPGLGFYELTKPVKVQDYKKVVVEHIPTGEMFTGPNGRKILDLPESGTVTIKPKDFKDFRVFIQSTSNNRKLLAGTTFLYEVEREVVEV